MLATMSERSFMGELGVAAAKATARVGRAGGRRLTHALGGSERTRVILVLAAVLGLSSADAATVGAAAAQLRSDLGINNTDVGLLVTVTSIVGALASVPFGILADRVNRTRMLSAAIVLWGIAMVWSATVPSFSHLLLARVFLGGVTAVAGPTVASLIGDWVVASERGRVYSYILSGELVGAAIGFALTGSIATLSWRASFVFLALPAFALSLFVFRLRKPQRGGIEPLFSTTSAGPSDPDEREGPKVSDAQRLARERGAEPDPEHILREDPARMSLISAVRYVLSIPTNVALILSSAFGYYFLAGVQTFGVEFVTKQYGVAQVVGTLVLLVVGAAGVAGVLAGGAIGDRLLRRGYLNGRILVAAIAGAIAVACFIPAIFTRSALT